MAFIQLVMLYFAMLAVCFGIDLIWLGLMNSRFYKVQLAGSHHPKELARHCNHCRHNMGDRFFRNRSSDMLLHCQCHSIAASNKKIEAFGIAGHK